MKKIVLLSLGITLVLSACGKFRYDKDQSAEVNYKVESAFDEMTNISDQAITGNMVYYKNGGVIVRQPGDKPLTQKTACNVIITIDTIASIKTVTVDYGSSNCDCNDGKTRRGKIITTFTGFYHAQGTIITHTPVDYYVNDIKIEGIKTVENMGLNTSGQPYPMGPRFFTGVEHWHLFCKELGRHFLAEGYNLYDISYIMHIPLSQILSILTRKLN